MQIQPTPGLASLAGTARAQSHGTDNDRRSPSADVARDAKLNAVHGVEAGTHSDDRDADGRQTLEHRHQEPATAAEDHDPAADADPNADRRPPSPDGSGTHIDFQV